jgi:hypothetical protein
MDVIKKMMFDIINFEHKMIPEDIYNSVIYRQRAEVFDYDFGYIKYKKISFSRLHNQILESNDILLLKDGTFAISYMRIYQYGALESSVYAYSPFIKSSLDVAAEDIIGVVQKEDEIDYKILREIYDNMLNN